MVRYIPGRAKIKTEFMKGVTIGDIVLAAIILAGGGLIIGSNIFVQSIQWWVLLSWMGLGVSMFLPVDEGVRLYASMGLLFRFAAFRKKYLKRGEAKGYAKMSEMTPFLGIELGKYIDFGGYKGMVAEIMPLEFGLLDEEKQDLMIRNISGAMRRLSNSQSASIVKVRLPMVFDGFLNNEDKKYEMLQRLHEAGEYTNDEVLARGPIFEERVFTLDSANRGEAILQDRFYLVVYGSDREALEETVRGMCNTISSGQMSLKTKILDEKEIVAFLKANYSTDVNYKEIDATSNVGYIDYIMPNKIEFKAARTIIDGVGYRNFVLSQYPLRVGNAWGHSFFSLSNVKVVMNFKPMDKFKAEKMIDRSIWELDTKLGRTGKSSRQIELSTQLDTLKDLLVQLKNNGEQLMNINVHIQCQENVRKDVRAILKQHGYRVAEMFGRQIDAFVSSNISRLDTVRGFERGVPSSVLAATFPFISSIKQDSSGFYIGDNEYPVFVDFFLRDNERINSNMMVIGKSGSGKSYATKMLLTNLAADKTKMFILDPEKEYVKLATNLGGQVIDVGSPDGNRINPFHIMVSLKDEDEIDKKNDDFSVHLQFLEQFFRVVLDGINSDAFEALNTLVVELYGAFGINSGTDILTLETEDFPIFDDLYALILTKQKLHKEGFYYEMLLRLQTYIQKFSEGGRNANLWNGPTTLSATENLVLFNFRTLFSNRNDALANAQMLLIFKFLQNEINKNRDFNMKYNIKRQVVIAVDEAHMFINPKFPIALDFMAEMAKRIRKYEGMQIIITQNIKDFVGSPDIERQSSAIINASQYSLIFQLAPNDMSDLLSLYRSAGGLTKEEQEGIVTAGKGECFLITGPLSRTFVKIVATKVVRDTMGGG